MTNTFAALKAGYSRLWAGMVIRPGKVPTIDNLAKHLIAAKTRYEAVTAETNVPWFVVALIHQMECGGDFRLSIAQGDPWNKVSTHVPKGRGPFPSWKDAAVDALSIDGTSKITDWTVERLCYELEKYNGFGSRAKGINTPYLWSYSNQYTSGKYVADHVWDANAVSGQVGAMPLLKRMMLLDQTITFAAQVPAPAPPPDVEPVDPTPITPSKPMVKSKTVWASILAAVTTMGSAFTEALGDWKVWCAVVVLLLLAYIIWERNGKPDIRGWFRS